MNEMGLTDSEADEIKEAMGIETKKKSPIGGIIIVVLLVGAGAFFYIKNKKQ